MVCRVGKNGIWDVVLLGKGEKIAGICVFLLDDMLFLVKGLSFWEVCLDKIGMIWKC